MPSGQNRRASELAIMILNAGRLLHQRLGESCRRNRCDISFLHLKILMFIEERPRPMKEVAEFLGVRPPSATALVERLVAGGQLRREADPEDRRASRVSLTPGGRRSMLAGRRMAQEALAEAVARLDAEEQAALAKILAKLTNRE